MTTIAMPPEPAPETLLSAELRSGADRLACPLTDGQIAKLAAYAGMLAHWTRVYNLTAVRDPERIGAWHLLDSLAIVPVISQRLGGNGVGLRILDVGSGGGLPGVVLAIVRPGWSVRCVDAVSKKVGFVRQVALELGLSNLVGEHRRVGEGQGARCSDLVVSRAFAALPDFCRWTSDELAPGGSWLAMKGKVPTEEISALPDTVDMFHVEHLAVPGLDAERCAVWMRPAV
jgi:16S rRNA (guanine527-N7)-methyltransferase